MRRAWLVAVLAAVAVGLGVVANHVEDTLDSHGPTAVNASMGEDVEAYPYTIHVNGARAATTVIDHGFADDTVIDTDGVWVVVDLSYATAEQPMVPNLGVFVRDAQGREFPLSSRSGLSAWTAGADIWVRGELAFEVAPDAVGSLELVFDPSSGSYGPMPMQYAVVPLGLDPSAVTESTELVDSTEVLAEGER